MYVVKLHALKRINVCEGYDAFLKDEKNGKVSAAIRCTFFSPESCKQTTARLYDALRNSGSWNWLVYKSQVKELDESTCVIVQISQGYEPGNEGIY